MCLFFGPHGIFTSVFALHLDADGVGSALEEVRTKARERGVHDVKWWIGPDSKPPDLVQRLGASGVLPDDDSRVAAMVLLDELPASDVPVVVRPVSTIEELCEAEEVGLEAFQSSEEERQAFRENIEDSWALQGRWVQSFAAYLDGRMVGSARSAYLEGAVLLIGGAVLPEARGRGAYRALVQARWDDAVERGLPALIVHAGSMSRPILERLGFETVCELEVLEDTIQ
jgi:GNAT superfamily N-acetyltransferase